MNKDAYKKLKDLTDSYNQADDGEENAQFMIKIEDLLLKEGEKNPKNNEIWFRLIALEFNPPLYDPDYIAKYANKILENDPGNIEALIVKAYAPWLFLDGVPDEMAIELSKYKNQDPEKEAMALIVLNLYYQANGKSNMVEECAKKALSLAPHFPKPYFDLARCYENSTKNQKEDAQILWEMGRKNVIRRTWGEYYIDPTDINEFFKRDITGIYLLSE